MFGHGRTPGTCDFELIKEGFHVAESAIPQLVFVNNPHKFFGEGSSFQDVLQQHGTYIQGARQVLNDCILKAENSLERRLFHRMRERLTSFLFVSAVHRSGVDDNSPETDFSEAVRKSLESLITQRLKPAKDLIVSALMEFKIFVLSSKRSSKIRVPHFPPAFFKEGRAEFVVTLADLDELNDQVDELFRNWKGKKQRDLEAFLFPKYANLPLFEEILGCAVDYHLEEASFRTFLVCHLLVNGLDGELDEDKVGELREQLYDDFKGAMESADLLCQEGVFGSDPDQATRGRKRNEVVSQEKTQTRDHLFAIRHSQLVSTRPFLSDLRHSLTTIAFAESCQEGSEASH